MEYKLNGTFKIIAKEVLFQYLIVNVYWSDHETFLNYNNLEQNIMMLILLNYLNNKGTVNKVSRSTRVHI